MRPRTAWMVFALAFAVMLGVMGWGTAKLLQLERERVQTEQRAALEEQVRLALWRMDTALSRMLSVEIAATGALAEHAPLPEGVRMRFSIDEAGVLVPGPGAAEALTDKLETALQGVDVLARLDDQAKQQTVQTIVDGVADENAASLGNPSSKSQQMRNAAELSKRWSAVQGNIDTYRSTVDLSLKTDKVGTLEGGEAGPIETGTMRPMWIGDELLVVRTIVSGGSARAEGSWLDWPALRSMMLDEIADLLPEADLERAPDAAADEGRLLATLPIRLVPGALPLVAEPGLSPLRATVITGWAFLLLAAAAVALLLRASLSLSERRAAFVSAVTHELRTPLTTFRMYTEMLQAKMVEEKRERYLATLRREAERLGSLVENVLAYARIESDRTTDKLESISVATLVDRMRERLQQRCAAARLELTVDVPQDVAAMRVRVDPEATEQILFNLVDNAAKYAPSEDDPRVRLWAKPTDRGVELHVRDYGPGIPAAERKKIFEPFAKGSEHAAGTQPGVGLGLALSARLARQMGGDLALGGPDSGSRCGADFVLTVARA